MGNQAVQDAKQRLEKAAEMQTGGGGAIFKILKILVELAIGMNSKNASLLKQPKGQIFHKTCGSQVCSLLFKKKRPIPTTPAL